MLCGDRPFNACAWKEEAGEEAGEEENVHV
jgi:hypothetical protein